jgi:hypothetical protein
MLGSGRKSHGGEEQTATDRVTERSNGRGDTELSECLWWQLAGAKPFPLESRGAQRELDDAKARMGRVRRLPILPSDRVDLNRANFEVLRSVGLSGSQAARLLAQRARLGGFSSLDELDQLPGFPRGLVVWLKQRATV